MEGKAYWERIIGSYCIVGGVLPSSTGASLAQSRRAIGELWAELLSWAKPYKEGT